MVIQSLIIILVALAEQIGWLAAVAKISVSEKNLITLLLLIMVVRFLLHVLAAPGTVANTASGNGVTWYLVYAQVVWETEHRRIINCSSNRRSHDRIALSGCPIHSRLADQLCLGWQLLLSRYHRSVAQELLGINVAERYSWLWLGGGVVLIGSTLIRPEMQFCVAILCCLTAIYGATILLENMTAMIIWQSWFGGSETSWTIRFFGERLSVVLLSSGR